MARPIVNRLLLLSLLGCVVLTTGCASDRSPGIAESRNSPEWISRPNRIYDEGSDRVIFAVGMSEENPNRMMQMSAARSRARTELARTLGVLVQSMVKDYMSTNRDFYESMDTSSSVEYTQDISRQVTDQMVTGAKQWDDYRDPIDRSYFVLMRLDFDDVIMSYQAQMNAAYQREVTRKRIKASADEFERDLDEQLDKLHTLTADEIDALLGGD